MTFRRAQPDEPSGPCSPAQGDKMSPKPGDELAVDEHAARRIRESIGRAVVANPLPLACRKTPPQAQHVTTRPPTPRRRDYERGGRLDAMQRAIGSEA